MSIAFEQTSEMLEAALRFLEVRGEASGGAVDACVRRAAFARYERMGGDLKLPYRKIRWTSERKALPTTPIVTAAALDVAGDRPALVVENAGGLVHAGAVCLQGPPGARDDVGAVILPLADARRLHPELLAGVQYTIVRKRSNSDGSLRADALLLSKHARIEVKPEFEVRTNEVCAFHGASIGSLDKEALFYVGTRGIARAQAVRLIALAFFEPAVRRFQSAALQDEIRTALDQKIDEAGNGVGAAFGGDAS